jgi:hypothetical protein
MAHEKTFAMVEDRIALSHRAQRVDLNFPRVLSYGGKLFDRTAFEPPLGIVYRKDPSLLSLPYYVANDIDVNSLLLFGKPDHQRLFTQ